MLFCMCSSLILFTNFQRSLLILSMYSGLEHGFYGDLSGHEVRTIWGTCYILQKVVGFFVWFYFSSMKIGKHVGSGLVINGIDRKFMFKALENVSAKTENCLHMYVGREPSEHADAGKNLLGIESWIEEWEVDIQLWPCIFQGAFINAINLSRWNITPAKEGWWSSNMKILLSTSNLWNIKHFY